MTLTNETPTEAEKAMYNSGYGLYLKEKRADYGHEDDYIRYVVCYPEKDSEIFPKVLSLPEERVDDKTGIAFERITETVSFFNILPDYNLISLVRKRMAELGFNKQAMSVFEGGV